MIPNLKTLIVISLICLLPGCTLVADSQTAEILPVQSNPGKLAFGTENETLNNSKTVLLFTSDNCSGCRTFVADVEANKNRIPPDVSIQVIPLKENQHLALKYQVNSPHIFVQLDSQGNYVHKWQGCETLADFTKNLF